MRLRKQLWSWMEHSEFPTEQLVSTFGDNKVISGFPNHLAAIEGEES